MWRGTVGQNLSSFPRGRVAAMTVLGDEPGQALTVGPELDDAEEPVLVTPFYEADPCSFAVCPICLTAAATSREHVGPEAIGGRCLTKTCPPCNNDLGRLLDKALAAWCTSSWDRLALTSPNVFTGHRYLNQIVLRMTERGHPVWVVGGEPHPDVRRALQSPEESTLSMPRHNLYRVQLAALKNAYLAAAVLLGSIPQGEEAHEIRRILVAVRDHPRDPLPDSPLVRAMLIARSKAAPNGPAVALTTMTFVDGSRAVGLSFSGVLSTSWPMPSIDLPAEPPEGARTRPTA